MSDSENDESQPEVRDEDTIKILLATDCHLGYEHSTKRLQENDSFITFEEILKHALEHDVDLVLLGGDLFHDSKPTQNVILQCMQLLKEHVLSDRKVEIQFLSNPEIIFSHSSNKIVNYEDPNMNVGLPIFSIHGNHDNPSFESTGSMDILGASGYINYFGKWSDLNDVQIPPLIIKKGKTFVSLYGLSYMNDQRLSRLLRDDKLNFLQPAGIPETFKIFVLHQNRAKHTANGYIPENKLPGFLDLVFWGHEHECRVRPEQIVDETADPPRAYYITQPGSSVATSLCEGESKEKHIGLLKVHGSSFAIEPIKLKTVRPFVFDSIHLRDIDIKQDYTKPPAYFVCKYIEEYIENVLLPKARLQLTGHPKQPTNPLVRLRIFYTEETEIFDVMRISRKYCDTVANPRDMIFFRKDRSDGTKKGLLDDYDDDEADINEYFRNDDGADWNVSVRGSIKKYFARDETKDALTVVSVDGLNEALKRYVESRDDDAFQDVINHQLTKNMKYMEKFDLVEEEEIIEQLKVYRDERNATDKSGDEKRDVQKLLDDASRKSQKKAARTKASARPQDDSDLSEDKDSDDDGEQQPTSGRGRGTRGRGRAAKTTATRARGGSSRGRGRAAKTPLDVSVSARAPKQKSLFETDWNSTRNSKNASTSSASDFRSATASQKAKNPIYVTDSDSD